MIRVLSFTALALLATAAPSIAQATGDPALARIDSLVGAGQLADARSSLTAWLEANPPGPGGAARGAQAHALFLKGRLASDWTAAEDAYLSLVLGYPTSPWAPDALLLLGKGLLAAASTGSPSTAAIRAVSYLERLTSDYPGHPLHDEAQLWLARAHAGAGRPDLGCAVLRRTLPAAAPQIATAMRTEVDGMCTGDVATGNDSRTDTIPAAARRVEPPVRRDTLPSTQRRDPEPARGRFTVQVAAMRSREGALQIARDLGNAGFDARVVDLEGSGLIRVRVGTFPTEAAAASAAARIRSHGFDAVVVDDVNREIRAP